MGAPTCWLRGLLIGGIGGLLEPPVHQAGAAVRHVLSGSSRGAWRVGGCCRQRRRNGAARPGGYALLQAVEQGVVVVLGGSIDYCESELGRVKDGTTGGHRRRGGKRRRQQSRWTCVCNVRSMILACNWALTPLEGMFSCLHIFCRSLFSSVLQRWISMGAICCRLDEAMVVCVSGFFWLGRVFSGSGRGATSWCCERPTWGVLYTGAARIDGSVRGVCDGQS